MKIHKITTLTIITSSILFSLFLTACTQPAADPKTVADKYWQLLQSGNTLEAEKLVSINSRRAFPDHSNRVSTISQLNTENATTVVNTTITTTNPLNNFSYTQTFDTVLVLQQGEWKIDVNQSSIPPSPNAKEEELQKLAEDLSQSMQENIDTIDETMNEGMQLLNEALREGSQEMGDSLLHLMNELNKSMQESINKMKERRQPAPEQTPQENKNQPDPTQGEGMI